MVSQNLRTALAPLLLPVSALYGLVTSARNKLFDWHILKSQQFDLPVICVGNITVGGTGKTPHVEYLIRLLSDRFKTAVLSRGYRRNTRGYLLACNGVSPGSIGDEPYQMYRKFSSTSIAVAENRVRGIQSLQVDKHDLQCVILDDAFQHRHVHPGVSIVLVDYHRPLKDDFMLPMGNLREKRHGIHRANIVLVTKVPHEVKPIEKRLWIKELNLYPYQFLFFTSFHYGMLTPVIQKKLPTKNLSDLKTSSYSLLLLSGIANPKPFFNQLTPYASHCRTLQFSDHHEYTSTDIQTLYEAYKTLPGSNKLVITTEKDSVKLENMAFPKDMAQNLYYLPIEVVFLDNKQEEFDNLILSYVEEDKAISRLRK